MAKIKQIVADLRRRLAEGEWPVGSKLPLIGDLSDQYEVASSTVRAALYTLEKEGLVRVVQGSGTFVQRVPRQDDSGS